MASQMLSEQVASRASQGAVVVAGVGGIDGVPSINAWAGVDDGVTDDVLWTEGVADGVGVAGGVEGIAVAGVVAGVDDVAVDDGVDAGVVDEDVAVRRRGGTWRGVMRGASCSATDASKGGGDGEGADDEVAACLDLKGKTSSSKYTFRETMTRLVSGL
jgi:hypothetical protein